MFIYNTTINIDLSIHQQWLIWIKSHIQKVLATGKFISAKMVQVLVNDDIESKTYSIQYTTKTRKNLDDFYKIYAQKLAKEGMKKFSNKMIVFSTELKIIEEFYPIISSN